jgi:aspartate beta-hydroxylase
METAEAIRTRELIQGAERALHARDAAAALCLLRQAEALEPGDPEIKMQLALALRLSGDLDGAIQVLDVVLTTDPYHLLALLSKGFILEKAGRPRAAAETYRNALQSLPEGQEPPAGLKAPIERARAAVREDAAEAEAFLRRSVEETRARHAGDRLDRFDLGLKVLAGTARAFQPQPMLFHYPKLPAEEFYERELFPWLGELEAGAEAIREELLVVMREDLEGFDPYIQYPPGAPVNQWVELNHSPRWNSYFLWKDGARLDDHCERCPRTAGLLARLPMLDQPGFGPTAMFSVLEPHTHIPAHTGSTNTRAIVHLPLILPGQCRFRVGHDVREWKMGQAWVFDDTMEHEAWNDSDKTRVVLIFDVWNPCLSAAERELVTTVMAARKAYRALG